MAQKNLKIVTTATKKSNTAPAKDSNKTSNFVDSYATFSKQSSKDEKSTTKKVLITPSMTRPIENFVIVWLDANINETQDHDKKIINNLRMVTQTVKTFTNATTCIDNLIQIEDEKVFLIVSDACDRAILSHLQCMPNVEAIYVFSRKKSMDETWMQEWSKIKGVFIQIENICHILKKDTRLCIKNLTPISIVTTSNISYRDVNELDQSFMYSQLLKEILFDLKYQADSKKELVDFCRNQYCDNATELKIVEEFDRNYEKHSPIWWYTRECFIYSMLNKALRTQDIEIIIKMGFFIRDLHVQIEQLHTAIKQRNSLTVYRGQGMLNNEFQRMRQSKGGLLSFNNFLSTSIDRNVSLQYATSAKYNPDLTAILFCMEIDPTITTTPFALLNNISYYSDTEKEVLFSMHTIFRIGDVEEIEKDLWQVQLTVTSDKDEQLKRLTERIRKEIGNGTGWYRLGQLMIKMGKLDKAQKISTALLNSASENDVRTIAICHHQLGCIHDEKGNLRDALSHYKISLDASLSYLSPNDPSLVSTYANIGSIYRKEGDLDTALEYFQRALNIDLHVTEPDQLNIATHYNNIGLIFKQQNNFEEALKHYERALEIKLNHLPPRHPSLAIAYSNISGIYQSRKDYSKALSFLEKALEIKQKSLPNNHPSLIMTYHNMATVLEGLHQYKEAIVNAEHALNIARQVFEPDHAEIKDNQEYLDKLRQKL